MQNIRLIIPGSYYDSQIYAGKLYLWTSENTVITINWDRFVSEFSGGLPDHLKFATNCAFRKSSYLYGEEWKLFIQDIEMKEALLRRFEELSKKSILFDSDYSENYTIKEQDNPFPFPHADTLFYYGELYTGSRSGLQVTNRSSDRNPLSPRPTKIWDGPVLSIAANNETLALAAGSEGLYECDLPKKQNGRKEIQNISDRHSQSVRWLYASLFSSSYRGGFLADYDYERTRKNNESRRERRFIKLTSSSDLFHSEDDGNERFSTYSWGAHDKLCLTNTQEILVVRYSPNIDNKPRFTNLGSIKINNTIKGDILNADCALFGYIIETDDGILIVDSQLNHQWIEGEPVNWRVFPDSIDYTNHLHIIYEDRLEILSFYQDYFVDQETKKIGIKRG